MAGVGVLAGLKVLDLTTGVAGPMVAMLLGDNGASVTKIEPPSGDPARRDPLTSLGYKVWQRGKRSAFLDLTRREDKDTLLALVRTADVLVESYVPGECERLGIDYATLSKLNRRLIYCSITGYGRDNPHSARPAIDTLVQARTGLMYEQRGWPEGALNHLNGIPDPFADVDIPADWVQGAPRSGPLLVASRWPSLGAFFSASLGLAAALRAREITGKGQWVETSLLQGCLAGSLGVWQRAEKSDAPGFDSWILGSRSPKGHFKTRDGKWIHNWVPNPRFVLQAAAGEQLNASADLTVQNDPDRFGTGPEELLVMSHYQPIMAEAVAKFPQQDWIEAAAVASMTMQPVRSIEESLADPAFLTDGCVTEVRDPEFGAIRTVGSAYNMSLTPGAPGAAPVPPGADTDEIKAEASRIIAEAQASRNASAPGKLASPLEGIVVLDLGLAVAGPFGTQLLSDLGATVIKINGLFDLFWHRVHIAYTCNRGKKSITLNLKDPRAMQIFMQLAAKADIVQHNMRYDAAERLKIDYESLKAVNPKLIYCHTRGFERGPRQALPGNDQTGACLAGLQYEDGGMGRAESGVQGRPIWSLTSFGDTGNGFLSAIAMVNALYHRDRTGLGQFVDTSIINACLLNSSYVVASPEGQGFERPRIGALQLGYSAGHRIYETRDRWIALVVRTSQEWDRALSILSLSTISRTDDAALAAAIAGRIKTDTAQAWFEKLDQAGIPVEIVDDGFSRQLHDNPLFRERRWVVSYPHPIVGRLDQIGLTFSLSDTPGVIQGRPLIVGEHTKEILAGLGYTEEQMKDLEEQSAIGFPGMPRMPSRPKPGDAPRKGMAAMLDIQANQANQGKPAS
jgi:crotonobetainyl-CoA:carnitine CoA-transferase CaiB-like acyl-CoA transferase